jgi:hypothetical protein
MSCHRFTLSWPEHLPLVLQHDASAMQPYIVLLSEVGPHRRSCVQTMHLRAEGFGKKEQKMPSRIPLCVFVITTHLQGLFCAARRPDSMAQQHGSSCSAWAELEMNLTLAGKFAFNAMRTLICHCGNLLVVVSLAHSPNSSTPLYTAIPFRSCTHFQPIQILTQYALRLFLEGLLLILKYITVECNDKTCLIVVSNSPAFLSWTDAYMFRHSCLTLARANHLMCHTVIQTNSLMHAPSICMISNTARAVLLIQVRRQ